MGAGWCKLELTSRCGCLHNMCTRQVSQNSSLDGEEIPRPDLYLKSYLQMMAEEEGKTLFCRDMAISWVPTPQWMASNPCAYGQH